MNGEIGSYRLRKRFVRKTGDVRRGVSSGTAQRAIRAVACVMGLLTCTDVHHQQHELEAREELQDSLFQAQKLNTIGRLATDWTRNSQC